MIQMRWWKLVVGGHADKGSGPSMAGEGQALWVRVGVVRGDGDTCVGRAGTLGPACCKDKAGTRDSTVGSWILVPPTRLEAD
jgi:hypothetical protein